MKRILVGAAALLSVTAGFATHVNERATGTEAQAQLRVVLPESLASQDLKLAPYLKKRGLMTASAIAPSDKRRDDSKYLHSTFTVDKFYGKNHGKYYVMLSGQEVCKIRLGSDGKISEFNGKNGFSCKRDPQSGTALLVYKNGSRVKK